MLLAKSQIDLNAEAEDVEEDYAKCAELHLTLELTSQEPHQPSTLKCCICVSH